MLHNRGMNRIMTLMILALSLGVNSLWAARPKAREFQSRILMMRVVEVLNSRLKGLTECRDANTGYSTSELTRFKSDIVAFNKGVYHTQQEIVESALTLLAETEKHPKCSKEIKQADADLKKIQQKKFLIPMKTAMGLCVLAAHKSATCLTNVATILTELDPFCVTQNSQNIFGVKDPNACMAGDRLLGRVLRQKNDPKQAMIKEFLDAFEATISQSKPNSKIDLWKVFLTKNQDTAANRKKFMAILAFFYYAMGSAGGYVDGISDYYWVSALKELQHPEDVFGEFFSLRQKIDRYGHLIHKKAEALKLKLVFKQIPLDGMNRHDFMSMFLACHFKNYGPLTAKIIPNILGVGYESLDFVSHVKGDVSIKESMRNFSRDTGRYAKGSSLGVGFCNYKF